MRIGLSSFRICLGTTLSRSVEWPADARKSERKPKRPSRSILRIRRALMNSNLNVEQCPGRTVVIKDRSTRGPKERGCCDERLTQERTASCEMIPDIRNTNRTWTSKEDSQLREFAESGKSLSWMVLKHKRPISAIRDRLTILEISANRSGEQRKLVRPNRWT
jgi:hypothetical protein